MLSVAGAAEAIEFYGAAFGAKVVELFTGDDGRVAHARLQAGPVCWMLSDEYPDHGAVSPQRLGGSPVLLLLGVRDLEPALERALAAGATLERPPSAGPPRNAKIRDPYGHRWMLAETAARPDSPLA
jgi:PhnB protein